MKSRKSFVQKSLGALALAVAVSGNASAITIDLGNLTGSSFVQAFSYTPGVVVQDVFQFDLSAASTFDAMVSQFSFRNLFNISGLSLALTQPAGPALNFGPGPIIWTGAQALEQGNDYLLTVSGTVSGTQGGSYMLILDAIATAQVPVAQADPAPIPEPSEWLMLLAGLALVAGWTRHVAPRSGGQLAA